VIDNQTPRNKKRHRAAFGRNKNAKAERQFYRRGRRFRREETEFMTIVKATIRHLGEKNGNPH
jgi:hypothetical protein